MQIQQPTSLATLPDEILQTIFQHLDAKTLIVLGATARRFSELSDEPLLWKQFCQNEFRYWNSRQAFRHLLRDVSFQDWKTLYTKRHTTAKSTRHIIDEIVRDPRGRSDRIRAIVDSRYEVKDALLQAFRDSPSSPDHLAQRYWSHVALGCLHRSMALEQWTKIKYRTDIRSPIERSLAAFDMFILDQQDPGDIDDIFDRLDSYVEAVRSAYPDLDEQSPRVRAMTVASYLREKHWVGIDQGREYHSLDNMFLGVALFSLHRNSLPLISCVIYSYVARQFNLYAEPISFPMHVHVLVQSPPGTDLDGQSLEQEIDYSNDTIPQTYLYMDPFHSMEPVPLSTLQSHLRFIAPGVSATQSSIYLAPATHRDLLIRTAHNILNNRTPDARNLARPISPESAVYAAFFALVLFPNHPASLRTHLTELTQHFLNHYDHDIHTFQSYILPLTANLPDHIAYRNLATQLLHNDLEHPVPKLRSSTASTPDPVRYRVGQLFRHRRRNYLALIFGWDSTCEMTPQWISMNQVDRLPRGRNQPFYNVLVVDDRSTRYVAEENVVLLGPVEEGGNGEMVGAAEVEAWPIEVGKWMKRFEVDGDTGTGYRFVSNVRDQYPED